MDKHIELTCSCCGLKFNRLLKQYKYELKRRNGKPYSPLCGSKECKINFRNLKQETICDFCGVIIKRSKSQILEHNFCSNSCCAKFSNSKRIENGYTTKDLKKSINCSTCGELTEVGFNSILKGFSCKKCRLNKKLQKKSICIICGSQINNAGNKKYCDSCRQKKASLDAIARVTKDDNSIRLKSIACKYKFNDKLIRCDSKAEYSALNYVETHYDVLDINRSNLILEYELDGKIRRYNPDFEVDLKDGTKLIIECKTPLSSKDLQRKWKIYYASIKPKQDALELYCLKNGYKSLSYNKDMHKKYYNSLNRSLLDASNKN